MMRSKRTNSQAIRQDEGFAEGYDFYKLFWIFFVACILGVLLETVFCRIWYGTWMSRTGLIYGWFNPIYGFGAVLMTLCLRPFGRRSNGWLFVGGMLVGGAFEYVCSLLQEKMFGTVSWEYSSNPLNIGGRTSLSLMLAWGVLAILWLRWLLPQLSGQIERIPARVGVPLTWVLVAFMVFNMAMSAMAVGRQSLRREGIPPQSVLEQFFDQTYPDERLQEIYPSMRSAEAEAHQAMNHPEEGHASSQEQE